jgi:hypothetical protein
MGNTDLSLLLNLGQLNVGGGPEVAKVTDREVDAQTHLSGHDDKCDVPAQHCNDKKDCATSLEYSQSQSPELSLKINIQLEGYQL